MALKFDGKFLKEGSKTLCNFDGRIIRDGFSTGGKALCNVNGKIICDGFSSGGKALCNVEGDNIREGFSTGGKILIKVSDAARKIGATSRGPSTAAIWFKFCR